MHVAAEGRAIAGEHHVRLDVRQQWTLALVCLGAGAAPLAGRWIPDAGARIAYGWLLTAAYLAVTLFARERASLQPFWELSLAFFVLALVQVLNNSLPGYVATAILHAPPPPGNPFASTVSGTVVVQLVTTLLAIVPVIVVTLVSGRDLGSIYVRKGKLGGWLIFSIVFFALFYLFLATIPFRPAGIAQRLLPTNGTVTLARFLALTPALLVVSISNGFEEEFLFRGLFLQKYNRFFGAGVSNGLQAALFSVAHAGVTYTPSALLFILVLVFPLGLITGYLMRATNSVITPGIFHGALDMAIYLPFLTYVS
jgi:membrane protease YdiL (CAAX protease family)